MYILFFICQRKNVVIVTNRWDTAFGKEEHEACLWVTFFCTYNLYKAIVSEAYVLSSKWMA